MTRPARVPRETRKHSLMRLVEPFGGRLGEYFVEQNETVEFRPSDKVVVSRVEGYLFRGRGPEAYARALRCEHRQSIAKHLAADRLEDQVIRTEIPGRSTGFVHNDLVRAGFPHQFLVLLAPDQRHDPRAGCSGELQPEESCPA